MINNIFVRFMDFLWLGGPIFSKELLVSSRRKRNYFVRFAYPAILAVFVAAVWADVLNFRGSSPSIYQVSRMAQVGIHITGVVVWFQFIVVQLLAVMMLSTAISDEIYHKTLGVLMTTPIGSFQIVFSKLLSRLVQLILISSISLPLLAIVRLFGGVPWNYVFSSFCITLAAAVFAGSVSLFFSIYDRQSHLVITRTVLTCFFIYAMPVIAYAILRALDYSTLSRLIPRSGLFSFNPFVQMERLTNNLLSPISVPGIGPWVWPSVTLLGMSAVVLLLSGFCVRKVGLRQVTGQAGLFLTRRERKIADKKRQLSYSEKPASGKIRDIKWPPIIWREIANPLIKANRLAAIFSFAAAAVALIAAYGLCLYFGVLGRSGTQIGFVLAYFFVALVRTSTFAATSITSEKEARTWPILLISPIPNKEIAFGKIVGSCLRAGPYWLLLAVHVVVFTLAGKIKPGVVIPLALLAACSALLVSSVGVLFSSVCRRNSTSSSWNIVVFLLFAVPVCCTPLSLGSPFFAVLSIFGSGNMFGPLGNGNMRSSPFDILGWMLFSRFSFIIINIVYLLVGYVAFMISTSNIRRRIL